MEENYIVKSKRKKRLHFTLKLLIGLIVIALICFGTIFMISAYYSYNHLQEDHLTTGICYDCGDYEEHYTHDTNEFIYYEHDNGYTTVENGQCTLHKQKFKKVLREEYWDMDDDELKNTVVEHTWTTEPCNHESHNYKNRYDYAIETIKHNDAPISSSEIDGTYSSDNWYFYESYIISVVVYLLFAIYVIIKHLKNHKYEIVVTASGVQGRQSFGKRVTIPAYEIKSASKKGKHMVIIQTEDEIAKFKFITNSDEIIEAINNLDKAIPENIIDTGNALQANVPSLSQELKAYKELLDSGIISEQEYLEKIKKYNEKTKEN